MADPIMDLFDDPNLFGLDPLPEDLVAPPAPPPAGAGDPLAEALGLSGVPHLSPPPPQDPPPTPPPNPPPQPAPPPPDPEVLSQGNPFMGVSAPPPPPPPPPKIVILKAPPPPHGGPAPATPNGGKVTLAKVLGAPPAPPPATQMRAGGVAQPGGVVQPGGVAKGGVAQVGRQVKQLLLQPLKAGGGSAGTPLKPGLSLAPAQGESKRITLVLQQPAGSAAAPGQRHVVLGTLPGKLLVQGAGSGGGGAAKAAPGAPAKVVTIQLQVQPPGAQPGPPQKIQLVQPGAAGPVGVAQVPQVVGGAGQRLTVPLKVVLQPQAGSSSGASSAGLSVVKVLSGAEASAAAPAGRGASDESRRLEHQKKQEKANRIVAEAIARARARGEQNIPRVLNEDELPSVRPEDEGDRKRRRKAAGGERGGGGGGKEERTRRGKGQGGKSKGRGKASTITPVVGKKRKRNASSDNSDSEALPAPSPRRDDDGAGVQKRRSNRQVKRKKYTEDLDIKITDDEEEEELDVTGPARPDAGQGPEAGEGRGPERPQPAPAEPDGDALPSVQFFVENPSEEDAAIVDKVLSMRVVKKELPSGQVVESEEFFVKYKN
ncbi:chromodomain-helicase-DNA-binding protein 8-like [Cinclus cinclus]|uniref:chromodomain-helicase-DNA-binding protein 8-like n=1 Tax=Cinclus cinclus TaxID=127875 RepID=UPI002E16388F